MIPRRELKEAQAQIIRWRERPSTMVRELFQTEPDEWQADVLDAFPHKQRIAMLASKGPGKELCKNTVIPTPVGDRRFGDLVVGDAVFADDGMPTVVTAIFDNGIKPVWRVKFDDGTSVLAGAEHQWKVRGQAERARKSMYKPWSVLTTEQIIARGVRVKNGKWAGRQFEIPLHGAAHYPEATLPLDPYLVGVWLGDGTRNSPSYFKPYVEIEHELQRRGYVTSRSGDHVRILGMLDKFRELECFGCYSFEKYIPERFKLASPQQRRDLLCGLMDTDGCIGDDSHMEYDTTSKQLALDVVWLVRSLGGNALVKQGIKAGAYHDENGNRIECRDCYRVSVRTPFNPFRIAHKAVRWTDPMRSPSTARYLKRYIESIEPAGEADCMCITVDHPSACYLVNDFIVTHNTTVLAWLAWNFLLTRPHPKIAATSVTGDNLNDGLWTEMAKWQGKSTLLQASFTWTKNRIVANENPETWWMAARTWPRSGDKEQQAETLAGLHADYIFFILDESGSIPEAVMVAAEAALASGIEAHIVQAGNPSALEGPLYAAHRNRKLWHVVEINGDPDNPKRSPRVSIDWAREQIAQYGRESPWVMVNVLGRFPSASLNALIGMEEIEAAQKRVYRESDIAFAPVILGVDVARFGDDSSAIYTRRGIQAFSPVIHRNLDSQAGAGIVTRLWDTMGADAVFIDNTGGFGAGWIDMLRQLGRAPIGVGFAERAHEPQRFANKRAEMYFDAAKWIKEGGALPPDKQLAEAMTRTTYTFAKGQLLLEPKADVKAKLGYSPDSADAFVLTFAEPITAASKSAVKPRHEWKFDPFADLDRQATESYKTNSVYDPFGGR